MDTFWHVMGYVAIGAVGLVAAGILILWYFAKMMSDNN